MSISSFISWYSFPPMYTDVPMHAAIVILERILVLTSRHHRTQQRPLPPSLTSRHTNAMHAGNTCDHRELFNCPKVMETSPRSEPLTGVIYILGSACMHA
ncbi:hypothetical protein OH76DRAFT_1111674 [Lentinus brumalis]|uniref:Uncharacterized protein n=1 Tax=Lentinus brumalis TaxID=2498619 RepID=A0A371CVB8_9APHY|nr:hypothetical protein OH76DRAFT_1111674 [Polyporus brumalis]